ncbi:unnamed protein product [Rotaria socialis]|uniref:Uncharacterized protein n=1 Tax=Rotaria socialis TaxID=392032 RepID=A0A821VQL4_9BILA|nr:unnamed protein product [Rotaria socialis]
MKYEQGNENAVLVASSTLPVSKPFSLTEVSEIKRARKILRIILGVLIYNWFDAGNGVANNSEYSSRGVQIGRSLISVVFLSFGYFVAHRYSKIRLRVSKAKLQAITYYVYFFLRVSVNGDQYQQGDSPLKYILPVFKNMAGL